MPCLKMFLLNTNRLVYDRELSNKRELEQSLVLGITININ